MSGLTVVQLPVSVIIPSHSARHSRTCRVTSTDQVRVIVSRKTSQPDMIPLLQDPTPTPSELGAPSTSAATSDVESTITTATKTTEGRKSKSPKEKERRNQAKIRRQNAPDPEIELGA